MGNKTIIESIRDYFLSCPVLDEYSKINVNFLDVEATNYTIDGVPMDPIVKKYVDGGAMKQYLFVFASKEFYGDDVIRNIENSGFYEKLADWIEEQNNAGNLPNLGGNKECLELLMQTSGYLFNADEKTARYQMQARLVYYED